MKKSGVVALGGIMGALALICLLCAVIPSLEYAMPAVAGACLLPIAIECGRRSAVTVYLATAILALLLVPALEPRILYVAFFGYYPIVKAVLESRRSRVTEWVGKFLIFNVSVCTAYVLMIRFMGFRTDVFNFFGVSLPAVLLAVGNVWFWMYDRLLTLLVTAYWRRMHKMVARLFRK